MTSKAAQAASEPDPSLTRIDEIADRFEAAWQAGQSPRVAEFLGEPGQGRPRALLVELIKIDIAWRRRLGASWSVQAYVEEFPELRGSAGALPTELVNYTAPLVTRSPDVQGPASSPSAAPAEVPQTVGKYVIVRELARGGQAIVYRAVDPELAREVALKISRERLPADSAWRDRVHIEGRLLAGLEHSNLVRVHDAGIHEDRAYLVMEYVPGRNLEQYAQASELGPRQAAELTAQMARAVAAAHQRGVIHQDLKPRNILIDEQGRPRVIDFGLARMQDAWGSRDETDGGTVAFLAPEQARGQPISERTDVFGLGGILYYLLTRQALWKAETPRAMWEKARRGQVDVQALARVPRQLRAICVRALAAEPTARQAGADILAAELQKFSRRRLRMLAGAVLFAVALVATGLLAWASWLRPPALPSASAQAVLHVLRQDHNVPFPLCAPLRDGDQVKLEMHVPEGVYTTLFQILPDGRLEKPPGGPSDWDPKAGRGFWFPGAQKTSPLIGRPGTSGVLVCVRRQPLDQEEIQRLWRKAGAWPALPEATVLKLVDDEVTDIGPGREFGNPVDRPDPVAGVTDRLARFGNELKQRGYRVTALVFAHVSR